MSKTLCHQLGLVATCAQHLEPDSRRNRQGSQGRGRSVLFGQAACKGLRPALLVLLGLLLLAGLLPGLLVSPATAASTRATAAQHERDQVIIGRLKGEAYRYYYGVGRLQNYGQALQLYQQAAERGDAEAQFITGGMLYEGLGLEQPDRENGVKWLLRSAEQGKVSPESMNVIGAMYLVGRYVPQNYLEAKKWLGKAAAQGNRSACNDLAYLYYNGLGGEQDYARALALYEQAAMKGDVLAQANAGLMYASGTGVGRDRARGYAWYSLAAGKGNTTAALNRNVLMQEMSWEELNRAQALSLELYQRIEHIKPAGALNAGPVSQQLQ